MNNINVTVWDARNMRQSLEKLFPTGKVETINDSNVFKIFCTYEGITFGVICAFETNFQPFLYTEANGISMQSATKDCWTALKTSINNAMSFIVDSVCGYHSTLESCKLEPSYENVPLDPYNP